MSQSMPNSPEVSVIIATRNRASSLRETLQQLAHQDTHGQFTYEVLVVDNGSTDDTKQVVVQLAGTFPVPLRYCSERRPGQSAAQNTGMRCAEGKVFVFTDDDIALTPSWLAALWSCFAEEQADGVAGRILPRWIAPRPEWLTDEVVWRLGCLGCFDRGTRRVSLGQRDWWCGGNMAVRRHVVERLGGFDTRLLLLDNDTEYFHRCLRHGFRIVYEPAAVVCHKLGAERMTLSYFRRYRHGTGYFAAYWWPWRRTDLFTVMPLWWYLWTLRVLMHWVHMLLRRRPWIERFCDELRLRWNFSMWVHRLQLWPQRWLTVLWRRSDSSQSGTLA